MNARADSMMEMSFPASDAFSAVANVAASNIGYRLNYSTKTVRRLQGAVDAATEALAGAGNIKLKADWGSGPLTLTLSNSKAKMAKADIQELRDILTEAGATEASVKASSVGFTVSN